MRGGDKKLTHLEEIKKIEKNREERRIKMEEAKREKEERKVINAQSGKNVDIDFELMIEKSKFREKMLSPHASAIDLKVN
jgi:kinesin family protein 2/24